MSAATSVSLGQFKVDLDNGVGDPPKKIGEREGEVVLEIDPAGLGEQATKALASRSGKFSIAGGAIVFRRKGFVERHEG